MTPAQQVLDRALDLLWAQWSELGVPGTASAPRDVVVSPVDLILHTPSIVGDRDARLAMLVQAWCAQHGTGTFGLRELEVRRSALAAPAQATFDAWMAVLAEGSTGPWPAPRLSSPTQGPPIGERELPFRSDRRPAVQLRARSLFGVGVRADVVCALLKADTERRPLTSPDVAHLGHSSRAVQWTLAALETAGLVRAQKSGRTHSYTLSRPQELARVLDAEGLVWLPWHHALPIVSHLVDLAASTDADPRVRQVRAHSLVGVLQPHAQAVHGLPAIPVRPGDDEAADRLLEWGAEAIETFAAGALR